MTLRRGWARHAIAFIVVAFVAALPWIFAANIIWSR
jgi:hypothetical protein